MLKLKKNFQFFYRLKQAKNITVKNIDELKKDNSLTKINLISSNLVNNSKKAELLNIINQPRAPSNNLKTKNEGLRKAKIFNKICVSLKDPLLLTSSKLKMIFQVKKN